MFALIAALLASYRRFPLSDASYLCILAFLAMHAVGAHYSYAGTPLGFAAAGCSDSRANTTIVWRISHSACCSPARRARCCSA